MGGSIGEIRGWSKIEVYLLYEERTKENTDGTWYPRPAAKKECKRLMQRYENRRMGSPVSVSHLGTKGGGVFDKNFEVECETREATCMCFWDAERIIA